MEHRNASRSLGRLSEAYIALILGEAVSYLDRRPEWNQLASSVCTNTHSFALTRTVALGFEQYSQNISAAWQSVGALTRQSKRNLDELSLVAPFEVLRDLAESGTGTGTLLHPSLFSIREACGALLTDGELKDSTWRYLTAPVVELSGVREKMSASREDRVRVFEWAVGLLGSSRSIEPLRTGFILGYLCSRIAPGSLNHFDLLNGVLPMAPSAALWFGLCSGLQGRGQVLAFADGLGRRVLRDLEHSEDMFGRPRCDVALPELTILLGREKPLMDFRTSSTGTLMVELFPGVHTSIRWQRNSDFQQETFDRRDSSAETRALVRELSSALERVELIRRRLAQQVDLEPDLPSHTDSERRPKRR
jgi:hypothetical protein